MIIYFCSPFAGAAGGSQFDRETEQALNEEFARQCCREIALTGVTVFAPHLFFPLFLRDADEVERARGIESGLEIMSVSREVWFRLPSWRSDHSRGMKQERMSAESMGKTIVLIDHSSDHWVTNIHRLQDQLHR